MSAPQPEADGDAPPPRFVARYDARVQYRRLAMISLVAAVLIALPFAAGEVSPDAYGLLAVLLGAIAFWGWLIYRRARDPREQVVIDTDGVFVRDWHVGLVPWENIDFVAHSSSVRRSILSALTRSRRGPYLLFKFAEPPRAVSELAPPWSWLQSFWAEMELQEPVIQQYGLDRSALEMLSAIQDHIAWWQRHRAGEDENTPTIA